MREGSIFSLSGNALKIIAALSMVIDHVGLLIFPQYDIFRIIGRLAFPIFSYMIGEGCRHTRSKMRYLLQLLILGIVTTAVYTFSMGELYFNSLITFSCSVILIMLISEAKESKDAASRIASWVLFVSFAAAFYMFTSLFQVDYGFWGMILPVLPALCELFVSGGKENVPMLKLAPFAFGLVLMSIDMGDIQFFGLFALLLLALYNGKRGFKIPKYSFYVFYPLHIGVIYLISLTV